MCRCGSCGLVLGVQLELMIVEVFSNLDVSMILSYDSINTKGEKRCSDKLSFIFFVVGVTGSYMLVGSSRRQNSFSQETCMIRQQKLEEVLFCFKPFKILIFQFPLLLHTANVFSTLKTLNTLGFSGEKIVPDKG